MGIKLEYEYWLRDREGDWFCDPVTLTFPDLAAAEAEIVARGLRDDTKSLYWVWDTENNHCYETNQKFVTLAGFFC